MQLVFGLDALRDRAQMELLCHRGHCTHDAVVTRAARNVANEAAVDLQAGDGKIPQIAQVRIAGAEIVDRDPNPQVAQLSKSARALLWFIQESALQNFDPQPFGSEAALFEGRKYVVDE